LRAARGATSKALSAKRQIANTQTAMMVPIVARPLMVQPAGGFVFGCCAHLFGPQHHISPVHDLSPKRLATPTNNPRGHRPVPGAFAEKRRFHDLHSHE